MGKYLVKEFKNEVYVSGNLYSQNNMLNKYINKIAYAISEVERPEIPPIDLSLRQFVSRNKTRQSNSEYQ